MPHCLIIADDLTGALDSAVAFAQTGRRVLVARRISALPDVLRSAPDVVAVNTQSREIPAGIAAGRVDEVLRALEPADIPVVLKKVDSRLKGNVAAETRAAARALPGRSVVAIPAIPDMGRVQREGILSGEGIAEPIVIANRFDQPIEVPDALEQDALNRLVAARRDAVLWVGARGLAVALARQGADPSAAALPFLNAPLVIASGSRDPVTLSQFAQLRELGPVVEAPDGNPEAALPEGPLAMVTISDGGGGLDGAVAGARFAKALALELRRRRPASLLVTGGETANQLLDQLGVDTVEVLAEFRPGVPLCRIETPWGSVRLLTKSGGFGGPALLREIANELRETCDGDGK
ncbi:four-carbon acid sugar kinase family protein [uncultured Limimaricola sp.]|uniref:four-carbon acid sugar kinase family protein n=1 Tax=uncultured Limimaricola sp. TaxID=2211667 RepID=UPI0030F4FA03